MLSIFSSLVPSQQISLAGKYFRIALFSALCLLVIAPSLPAQAQQSFNTGVFAGRVLAIGAHWFDIEITAVPVNTTMVSAVATGGGVRKNWGKGFGNKSVPIAIMVGSMYDNNSINPGTSYTVQLQAQNSLGHGLAGATLTVTTKSRAPSLPGVGITNESASDHTISFQIVPVAGATYYRVPRHSGDIQGRNNYSCNRKAGLVTVRPANRNGQVGPEMRNYFPNPDIDHPDVTADDYGGRVPYALSYCNLAANREYTFNLEAWRMNADKSAVLIAESTHKISTKAMGSFQMPGSDSQDNELSPPPLYIEVDYPGDPYTEVSLAWEAVSGASGYSLEVVGGNSESYAFPLGAGATSQRVNGLTPGADYTAYLTAYLQDGGKRSGEAHFGMADPPPTNTPVPPTATPIPQQSSQDSVEEQSPPQLQYSEAKSEEEEQQPSGPYASLIRTLISYAQEDHGDAHQERWKRALAALGWGSHANPMTLQEAKDMADTFTRSRWQPVVDALTALQPPAPTNTPIPPPTATPIPPTPIPPTPVPPTPVPPTPVPPTPVPAVYKVPQSLINTLVGYQGETQHGDAHVERWTRALAALGHGSHNNPMTLSEAEDMADKYTAKRWQPVIDALKKLAGN